VYLLRGSDAVLHANGDVSSLDEHEAFLLTGISDVKVGTQGEDSLLYRHLQHQVRVVWHGHELGKGWSAEDGVVHCVEVDDEEVDVVGAEVLGGAELYQQSDLPEGLGCLPRNDPPERRVHGDEVFLLEPYLSGSDEQDIEGSPFVDEDLLKMHTLDDRIQHEGEMPRVWDIYPLVSLRKGDRVLQLVKALGVSDGFVVSSDRHDTPGDKLLLPFVVGGSSPTKDGGTGLGGILVGRAWILLPSFALAVVSFVVVAP
jgi:hypothetical protein